MDPRFEQRLRDEVIYLHSLWHQGPPRTAAAVRHHLQASQATQFKKQKKPKRKNRKSTTITDSESPGSEWPCPAAPPPTTGWPSAQPKTNPPLSAEEEWKLGGIHSQKKALKVVHEFFTSSNADDSDAIDSSSDDDDELMEKDDERDAYSFFNKLLEEDAKLREYYEKSFANGEFSCLVCGALGGKKTFKKFKGCLPLVQHSITMYSKKRRAHRAFGQAVCNVLGWDLDHLPAIVSMLSDKLGENSATRADAVKNLEDGLTIGNSSGANKESSSMGLVNNNLDSVNNDTLQGKIDEAVPESGYMGSGISLHDDGDMNSMMYPNAGKNLEDCGVVHTCPEEEWKLAGIHAQKKALKVVHEFFTSSNADDSDAIDSSSDDDDELMEKDDECDAFSFFNKVFEEDTKLREYYEKSLANGEFSCLVCGALGGKKTLKKFKGCLPLVQHSITIYSKKRRAHRAFGQAVCKVLGWDLDHLSAIVSMLSDKMGEGKCNNDTFDGKNDEAAPGSGCMGSGISPHGDEGDMCSLTFPDADKNLKNLCMVYRDNVEDPASQGLKIGNSSGANKESSSMGLVNNNLDSVNNDTLKGKIDEAVPESGCMGSGISLHGDEGDMNSMMCPNAGKNLKDCGAVHTQNVEEHASDDGLAINSLTFPDSGGNKENLCMAHQHEVEEPAS
ncbi:hypothetical protein ACS0TY_018536 [Phlomoides rotata]